MSGRDLLAALLVQLIWGANFIVVKTGLAEMPPLLMVTLRFAVVAMVAVPFFRPPWAKLPSILALSTLFGVGHFGLIFLGMSRVDAASAAIVVQLGVPFNVLLAAVFFGDRLSWSGGLGMGIAFVGVFLLAGEPTLQHPGWLLVLAVAMWLWALSNILIKRLGSIHPIALSGWMAMFAAPQLLLLSLVFEEGQMEAMTAATWRGWGTVGFTAVAASLIGYSLWCSLISRYPMTRVVPMTLIAPVIGVISGVVVLGEALTWQKLVGGLLAISGVAIIELLRPVIKPGLAV